MNDFFGLPVETIGNKQLRVNYLTSVGPRIIGLNYCGQNLLAQTPEIEWDTPNGIFHLRGGHRLWVAPEVKGITYIPDDSPPSITKKTENEVRITGDIDPYVCIQKSISVRIHSTDNGITITHEIFNFGDQKISLAPWGITQLRLGGIAIFPGPTESSDPDGFLPNRNLVFWPYADIHDPRLQIDEDYYFVKANSDKRPLKFGYLNPNGWMGYAWKDILFCKRFTPQPQANHADLCCNTEVYLNRRYIELESLGPLVELNPGGNVIHHEVWELFQLDEHIKTIAHLRKVVPQLNDSRP